MDPDPTIRHFLSLDDVERILASTTGTHVAEPRLGVGSFLTFELRKDDERDGWFYWIYQAAWRIERAQRLLAGSEDDRAELAGAVAALAGARVEGVAVSWSQDLVLSLDDNLRLRVFRVHTRLYDQWMLWQPNGRVLTASSEGWLEETRDAPDPRSAGVSRD